VAGTREWYIPFDMMVSLRVFLLLAFLVDEIVVCRAIQESNCYTNLTSISLIELDVKDLTVPRRYVLCPRTTFESPVPNSQGWFTDTYPLLVRSNAFVQCGRDGSSENSCIIDGTGTNGIIIDPYALGITDETSVYNVTIQGVTVDYFGPNPYYMSPISLGLTKGNVTFRDCIFSNNFGDSLFNIQQYIFSRRSMQQSQNNSQSTILKESSKVTNIMEHPDRDSVIHLIFDSCKFQVRFSLSLFFNSCVLRLFSYF
jgi:hypothetical protein